MRNCKVGLTRVTEFDLGVGAFATILEPTHSPIVITVQCWGRGSWSACQQEGHPGLEERLSEGSYSPVLMHVKIASGCPCALWDPPCILEFSGRLCCVLTLDQGMHQPFGMRAPGSGHMTAKSQGHGSCLLNKDHIFTRWEPLLAPCAQGPRGASWQQKEPGLCG